MDHFILLLSFLIWSFQDVASLVSNDTNVNITESLLRVDYCQETCNLTSRTCRCDDDCLIYGDCCKDKYDTFSDTEISETETSTKTCTDISGSSYFIVRNCSSSWHDDQLRELCEVDDDIQDIILDLPVYDSDGNHYKNMVCAFCNNIPLDDILAWEVLNTDRLTEYYSYPSENHSIVSDFGGTDSEIPSQNYHYTPPILPEHLMPRLCDGRLIINKCENETDTCPDYYSPVTFYTISEFYIYKNPDCANCSSFGFDYVNRCVLLRGPWVGLKDLIDGGDYETETQSVTCDVGEVLVEQICTRLLCSEGFELVENECVLTTCPVWILQFNVRSRIDPTSNINNTMTCLLQYFQTATVSNELSPTYYLYAANGELQQLQFDMRSSLDYSSLSSYLSRLFPPNMEEHQPKLCNVTSLMVDQFCDLGKPVNCSTDGIDVDTNLFPTTIGNQTMIYINQSQSFFSLDASLFRHLYIIQDNGGYNSTTQLFLCSRDNVGGLSCPFILDDLKNYVMTNDTLEHIESGNIYGSENYELTDNQTVKICSTFEQTGTVTVNNFVQYNNAQTILSVVGCILSLIALALTFIVYCLLSPLRTLPGKAVMSVTIALFCAQFLLTFGAGQTKITNFCRVIALAMHFFWLASFFWMSVLAYDISRTFNSNTYDRSKGDKWKTFVKYSIVAWGLPFIIVAICLTLSMKVESLGFQYGSTSICWISDPVISLIIFGGPVMLILLVNTVFFGLTVHGVRETMKTSSILQRSKMKSTMSELKIYFKIMSLMGFSWIFGFIATFTGVEILWYIFIILGTLQGVFIFLSFVCNARVYGLLRQKLSTEWRLGQPSTSKTAMTST